MKAGDTEEPSPAASTGQMKGFRLRGFIEHVTDLLESRT